MSDLVAVGYDSLATAQQVAANVVEAQKAHIIELDDLVVVERRQDGNVKLHQPSERPPARRPERSVTTAWMKTS